MRAILKVGKQTLVATVVGFAVLASFIAVYTTLDSLSCKINCW